MNIVDKLKQGVAPTKNIGVRVAVKTIEFFEDRNIKMSSAVKDSLDMLKLMILEEEKGGE